MKIRFLMDIATGKPACVNIQAAFGNNLDLKARSFFMRNFDAQDWETSITKNMRQVSGTEEEWLAHAAKLEKRRVDRQTKKQ